MHSFCGFYFPISVQFVGRAGVPMEVMGLMLGEFVDEYTVRVVDVFAMPQSGTGVSVEAVDHVFQTNMLDMLKQTGRYFFSQFVLCHFCSFLTSVSSAHLIACLCLYIVHNDWLINQGNF